MMKTWIFCLAIMPVLCGGVAKAEGLSDGIAAYEKKNYAQANKIFRSLAEKGEVHSQVLLGVMYYKGQYVAQDYIRAHMWYNIAAAKGDDIAQKYRATVAKKMTPAQIAEAQKLARDCEARYYKKCD